MGASSTGNNKLLIKNMVCHRCILTVENIFKELAIPFNTVELGEVNLSQKLCASQCIEVEAALRKVGFELIE